MTRPVRIQQKRGQKLPPNTKSVARPTKWGNPHRVENGNHHTACIKWAEELATTGKVNGQTAADMARELKGYNLACYCPADEFCHADRMLDIVNNDRPVRDMANSSRAIRAIGIFTNWRELICWMNGREFTEIRWYSDSYFDLNMKDGRQVKMIMPGEQFQELIAGLELDGWFAVGPTAEHTIKNDPRGYHTMLQARSGRGVRPPATANQTDQK